MFCARCGCSFADGVKNCPHCGWSVDENGRPAAPNVSRGPVQNPQSDPTWPSSQPPRPQPSPAQNTYQANQSTYQAPPQNPYGTPYVNVQSNPVQTVNVNVSGGAGGGESYFDGGLLQLIGWSLLAGLLTLVTLSIGLPWAVCMLYRWEINHTVINGHRLTFDGTGLQLLGSWIKWFFLTLITLGIYGFWVSIKLKKWQVSHTHFAN